MRVLIAIAATGLLLAACGEGQSPTVETGHGVPHAQTGAAPKIAFAGSPVRKSRSYINNDAIEPGEDWIDMGGEFVSLSSGYTLRAFETKRVIPRLFTSTTRKAATRTPSSKPRFAGLQTVDAIPDR